VTPPRTVGRQPAYPYDRGVPTEEDIRRIARAEARALLTSVEARNVYPPRSIPLRTVDRVPVVTAFPAMAVEGDEIHFQTSTGSIVPFIYLSGAWRCTGGWQKVTHAIASGGGLPLDGEFTKEFDDSILEIFMAGSGYRPGASGVGLIGMNLLIASVAVANITVFVNAVDNHESFVSRTYTHPSTALGTGAYAAGTYDLDLTAFDGNTSSDSNDTFYVTVTEKFAETV
jgi:hypothetical protein